MLQTERRSSIRRSSNSRREEAGSVTFDPRPGSNSRKSSVVFGGGSESRRTSIFRKGSTTLDPTFHVVLTGSPKVENELDSLRKHVPQEPNSRWSSELSLEARYAIFLGYSELLQQEIDTYRNKSVTGNTAGSLTTNDNVQKSSISSSRTYDDIPEEMFQKVDLNLENIDHKLLDYASDLEAILQPTHKKHNQKQHSDTKKSEQKRQQKSAETPLTEIEKAAAQFEFDDENDTDDAEVFSSNNNFQNSGKNILRKDPKIQLLMSRYLQYSHAMLDCLKMSTNSQVVRSNKFHKQLVTNNQDVCRTFELWNNSWRNFFILKNYSKTMI